MDARICVREAAGTTTNAGVQPNGEQNTPRGVRAQTKRERLACRGVTQQQLINAASAPSRAKGHISLVDNDVHLRPCDCLSSLRGSSTSSAVATYRSVETTNHQIGAERYQADNIISDTEGRIKEVLDLTPKP
ncbi:hypothetical protein AND_007186 [Anopheles darlingi]|uniref:Uncharacterized protein n=1 Tax=Anopheles darlingi TaxID=43151 RepID=W5JEB3_ANODA|nr:hypothetical protein AND_007186 [Anopheles darlingi]